MTTEGLEEGTEPMDRCPLLPSLGRRFQSGSSEVLAKLGAFPRADGPSFSVELSLASPSCSPTSYPWINQLRVNPRLGVCSLRKTQARTLVSVESCPLKIPVVKS